MSRARLAIAALGLVVLIAGYSLIPRTAERAAMMMRDERIEEARAILLQAYERGDRRPNIIVELAHVHQIMGDNEASAKLLSDYIKAHAENTRAFEELLKLKRWENNPAAQRELLEALVAQYPDGPHVKQLLSIYRLLGEYDAEMRLLKRLASEQEISLEFTERLAELLVTKKEIAAAVNLLANADEQAPETWVKPRLLLLSLLIEQKQLSHAQERALRWIGLWKHDWLQLDLVKRAAILAPETFTLDLVATMSEKNPQIRFPIIGMLASEGYRGLATSALRQWSKSSAQAESHVFNQYLYAAHSLGDASGLFSALVDLANTEGAEPETARFAEFLGAIYGMAALAPVRDYLTPEVLRARPLFAAELALHDRNPFLARHYLDAAEIASLTPREQMRWFNLTQVVEGSATVFAHLNAMRLENRLPPSLLGSFADLALELRRGREHDAAMLQAIRSTW